MAIYLGGQLVADVGGGISTADLDDAVRTAIRETVRDELLKPSSPGGWHRPGDWPDYSQISLTGFEGMYFTYRTGPLRDGAAGFASFTATTQGGTPFTVERGQIKGGAFVAEATFSTASGGIFKEAVPGAAGGYVVYRLTASSGITSIGMQDFPAGDGGTLHRRIQNCVERYGRLPSLTSFSNWTVTEVVSDTIHDCTGLTNLTGCWNSCTSLTNLDLSGWDVGNVTSLANCWSSCASLTSLDLSGWDVSNVTNLTSCWNSCGSLTSLDLSGWDVSNVTNLSYCWHNCASLTSLDLSGWDVSNVTNLASCWNICTSLTSLNLSGWDVGNVTNLANCWSGCSSLRELNFCPVYLSFNLSASACFSPDTLASVLALLPTVTTKQTATIGTANKAKLTAEQIAAATAKNWNVA